VIETYLSTIYRNAVIAFTGNIGANIASFASMAIFIKVVDVELFGYFVTIGTCAEIINRIFNLQSWQAFIKFASGMDAQDKPTLYSLIKFCFLVDLISLLVAFLVTVISLPFLYDYFYINKEFLWWGYILAIGLLFQCIDLSIGIFRLYGYFEFQTKVLLITAYSKLAIYIVVYYVSPSFDNFIYATIFAWVLGFVVRIRYLILVFEKLKISGRTILLSSIKVKEFASKGVHRFIFYNNFDVAVRMVSRQIDVVLIGRMLGAEAVAVYRVAKEVANVAGRLVDPVYQAIFPELSKVLGSQQAEFAGPLVRKLMVKLLLAAIVLYSLFLFFGDIGIRLAFGSEYERAYSIGLVYLLAISISVATLPLYPFQMSLGLAGYALINQIAATVLYLLALLLLIVEYGALGAAYSYVFYYTVLSLFTISSLRKSHHGKLFY
jgi:O-antigen/teichoic acid export membrane protein